MPEACPYGLGYEDLSVRGGIADYVESSGEGWKLVSGTSGNLSAPEVVDIHDTVAYDAASFEVDSLVLDHILSELGFCAVEDLGKQFPPWSLRI